jgi:hypothetical protein
MTISLPAKAKIVSKSQAELRVGVSCAPLLSQTSGSLSVTVTQGSGAKTAGATGSAAITCDGQTHEYVVQLVTAGRWHNGDATASATGTASGLGSPGVCTTDGSIIVCFPGTVQTDSGTAGPAAVELENG